MDVVKLRKAWNLSQEQFWGRIGISQSGGSRYEAGRRIPEPVRLLLVLAYGNPKECDRVFRHLRPYTQVRSSLRPDSRTVADAKSLNGRDYVDA